MGSGWCSSAPVRPLPNTCARAGRIVTAELNAANGFLETNLTSVRAAVVVLNTGLHVRVWNRPACPPTGCGR